jgi:hypothetical protein
MPTSAGNPQQFSYDVNQIYAAQVPSFSAMPTSNARISLGPSYQVDNDVSSKVKKNLRAIYRETLMLFHHG